MKNYRSIVLCVCACCLLFTFSAWAQVDYPSDLAAVVAQYPGSTVEMAMKMQQGTHAVLRTKDGMNDVFRYYKEALEKAGWKIQMEMSQADGQQGHWTKGDKIFHVVVSKDEDGTSVMLLLGANPQ